MNPKYVNFFQRNEEHRLACVVIHVCVLGGWLPVPCVLHVSSCPCAVGLPAEKVGDLLHCVWVLSGSADPGRHCGRGGSSLRHELLSNSGRVVSLPLPSVRIF